MVDPSDPVVGRPLLVCGMHRSGTSLTASLFHAAGVRLGDQLLGANHGNDRGHYEDLGIYEFHRTALHAQGLGTEGFVAAGTVVVPDSLQPVGRRLAAERGRAGGVWGWKEPRTVLFLDYWDAILPRARYVFVFRRPWEVVDSLFRRGDETFAANPAFAAEVWLHYNRTILDFVRRHEDRCLVVELDQVAADPEGLFAAVRTRLGIDLAAPPGRYEAGLLVRDDEPRHELAIRASLPEAYDVYLQLCGMAGTRSATETAGPHGDCVAGLARGLVEEWRHARRSAARAAELVPQVLGAREASATAEASVAALHGRLTELEAENNRLLFERTELAARITAMRDRSWLRRLRREIRRLGRQAGALMWKLCHHAAPKPTAVGGEPGHRDAA
ncbi:MAG: sulfotransferase [Planctomycetaceae bacterium]|nr:sulfotransferase [Planctomycetaceae bacterium]